MSRTQAEEHQRRHGFASPIVEKAVELALEPPLKIRRPKMPNKTEAGYGRILEAQKQRGEIIDYFYEGLSLNWGDGMRYTPDFVIFQQPYSDGNGMLYPNPLLIEIKGGHIWSRDSVRFKGCRAHWKRFFEFQMHQKKQGTWKRIL